MISVFLFNWQCSHDWFLSLPLDAVDIGKVWQMQLLFLRFSLRWRLSSVMEVQDSQSSLWKRKRMLCSTGTREGSIRASGIFPLELEVLRWEASRKRIRKTRMFSSTIGGWKYNDGFRLCLLRMT